MCERPRSKRWVKTCDAVPTVFTGLSELLGSRQSITSPCNQSKNVRRVKIQLSNLNVWQKKDVCWWHQETCCLCSYLDLNTSWYSLLYKHCSNVNKSWESNKTCDGVHCWNSIWSMRMVITRLKIWKLWELWQVW